MKEHQGKGQDDRRRQAVPRNEKWYKKLIFTWENCRTWFILKEDIIIRTLVLFNQYDNNKQMGLQTGVSFSFTVFIL